MILDEQKYVDKAEAVMKEIAVMKDKKGYLIIKKITTSKIRNLLAMSADIYNEVVDSDEQLGEDVKARIEYMRVRFIYEAGRNPNDVKVFIDEAQILDAIKEIKGSKKRFILFNHYMEALVAFHKFYGGKD